MLITKAKGQCKSNPTKWYKDIYLMTGFCTSNHASNITNDQTANTVELLQDSFTKPWQELSSTDVPSIEDVAPLLKENPPPIPSIGQVKSERRHLNPRKATGSDGVLGYYNAFVKSLRLSCAILYALVLCNANTQPHTSLL